MLGLLVTWVRLALNLLEPSLIRLIRVNAFLIKELEQDLYGNLLASRNDVIHAQVALQTLTNNLDQRCLERLLVGRVSII